MNFIISWLVGSKAGRTVILTLLGILSFGLVLWRAFTSGVNNEKNKQQSASLEALKEKVKTDEEIRNLSVSDRRDRLRQWATKE
jgi:anionic cell wall polymer biosynthesis LytR-Cps2A-Psr (LCP) family protein